MPLVLSGHTHGGQVVLPVVGALAAQKFPVVAGIGRRDRTTMFVSRGVGTIYVPVRINCPPEVAVLTLQPLEPPNTACRVTEAIDDETASQPDQVMKERDGASVGKAE